MDLDTFKPTFLIQIEGRDLTRDITQEITALAFEDSEAGLDELELRVTNRNLQFTDDPLFQEGNEIVARLGYVGNLSPARKAVIKEIDYEFPDAGEPTIRLRAFDKGFKLAGREIQKVWQKPAPGILYSEIAAEIASQHGLTPVVQPTKTRHLRVAQGNISDAQFLMELAERSRGEDGDGKAGYVFYVEGDELHFHPRDLAQAPAMTLEYFTDKKEMRYSFRRLKRTNNQKGGSSLTEETV